MRKRRHHNTFGSRSIRRGKPAEQLKRIAEKLHIKYE